MRQKSKQAKHVPTGSVKATLAFFSGKRSAKNGHIKKAKRRVVRERGVVMLTYGAQVCQDGEHLRKAFAIGHHFHEILNTVIHRRPDSIGFFWLILVSGFSSCGNIRSQGWLEEKVVRVKCKRTNVTTLIYSEFSPRFFPSGE